MPTLTEAQALRHALGLRKDSDLFYPEEVRDSYVRHVMKQGISLEVITAQMRRIQRDLDTLKMLLAMAFNAEGKRKLERC